MGYQTPWSCELLEASSTTTSIPATPIPTPVPTTTVTTFAGTTPTTTKSTVGTCAGWCATHSNPWVKKCSWRKCARCSECDVATTTTSTMTTVAVCKPWCIVCPMGWTKKCGWSQLCGGCPQCESGGGENTSKTTTMATTTTVTTTRTTTTTTTSTMTTVAVCKPWCIECPMAWTRKCGWPQLCGGCPQCESGGTRRLRGKD